tara:strand:- start:1141 stop:1389 length:249 start_codon:yes stop_codon:yes gene_type:complete
MATLLKSDGSSISNVEIDTLQQQQALVGGYIEYVYIGETEQVLIVNEEGLLDDYPVINAEASQLAQKTIVGDVILAMSSELN